MLVIKQRISISILCWPKNLALFVFNFFKHLMYISMPKHSLLTLFINDFKFYFRETQFKKGKCLYYFNANILMDILKLLGNIQVIFIFK